MAEQIWALTPKTPANGVQPVDADGFQVAEVGAVVKVAHRIHVAPTDRDAHLMDQFFLLGNFDFHGSEWFKVAQR